MLAPSLSDDSVARVPLERAAGLAVEEDRGAEVLGIAGELVEERVRRGVGEVGAFGARDGEGLEGELAGQRADVGAAEHARPAA